MADEAKTASGPSHEAGRGRANQRSALFLAVLILAGSFALRLANIWFGYPLPVHPDEPTVVEAARTIMRTGSPNPQTLLYPSLTIYLHVATDTLLTLPARLSKGTLTGVPEINFYLYGRALNVVLATLTIYLVIGIARRLFGVWTGVAAMCFVSASALHLTNSYYATVDMPTAFWSALAGLTAVLIHTTGRNLWFYIAGGIFVGCAISSKYSAFPAFLPILVAHVDRARIDKKWIDRNLCVSLLAVPAAFIVTTPLAVVDWRGFLNALSYQRDGYIGGHPGQESPTSTSFLIYLRYLFTEGYGRFPTVLAVAGLSHLFVTCRTRAVLLASFPVTLLLFLGSYKVFHFRNIVPVIPFLGILSGYGAVILAGRVGSLVGRTNLKVRVRTAATTGALLITVSILGQLRLDAEMTRQNSLVDTRWVALQWIVANLPAGAAVGREHYTPPIETHSRKFNVSFLDYFGVADKKQLVPALDFMIVSDGDYARFFAHPDRYPDRVRLYRSFFSKNLLIREFRPDGRATGGPVIGIYKVNHQNYW